MKRRQFGIRPLLLLTLCCAGCAGLMARIFAVRFSVRQQLGLGIQTDPIHWPYDLRNLVKNDEKLAEGLTPCGLAAGFDRISVWRLQPNAPMIEYLKQHAGLVTTNHLHPRASRLISQTPPEWPKLNWAKSSWFATPGFGTQHMECVDLFLLVIDSETGIAIVLHENHF